MLRVDQTKLSLSPWSELYIHIIMLPEDGEPTYQIYVGRIPTNVGTLYRRVELSWVVTVSASSSEVAIFQLPRLFSRIVCNWAARGSLLETITRFVLHFTAAFRVFKVISQLWQTRVKSFSRGAKQNRAANFHRWNASRMRRELTRALISQSALAHSLGRHWNPHQYQTWRLCRMIGNSLD